MKRKSRSRRCTSMQQKVCKRAKINKKAKLKISKSRNARGRRIKTKEIEEREVEARAKTPQATQIPSQNEICNMIDFII